MKRHNALQSSTCRALIAALLCACSGTPGTPNGPVVNSPGGGAPSPTPLVSVKLTVTLPPAQHKRGINPNYLSPNTQSLTIGLISVNAAPVTGVNATTLDTVAGSPNCKSGRGGLTCVTTISGSPGNDVFAVSTYAGRSATGALLSLGTAAARIGSGGGSVAINATLSLSINGVIGSLRVGVVPSFAHRGKPATAAVALTAYDPSGAQIVGGANYQSPVTLTIQGDAAKAFTLQMSGHSGPSLSIVKPTSSITLAYNGNAQASGVTILGIAHTASAQATFALKGKQPPPLGEIYALNLGTNNGQGATVTEYSSSANGNTAPQRTLQLDPALYARSIAVDSSGALYVGYFQNSTGTTGTAGQPNSKNIVAIYAPGASGNQKPQATLVADPKTRTALFPAELALLATGGLVTYGSTTVDANTGNAVLTYAAGSSGAAAPAHAFSFVFPTPELNYPGPTGLTLDQQGNVYLAGILYVGNVPQGGVFVVAASDIDNPAATIARTIPWDSTTQIFFTEGRNVALDAAGEIFVANYVTINSGTFCQGRSNVFTPGTTGGITDVPPLRVATFQGMTVALPTCHAGTAANYFPTIAINGTTIFAADPFNNAITTYATGSNGTVNPSTAIAGSVTQLNAPIALAISTLSSRAKARLVKKHPLAPSSFQAR